MQIETASCSSPHALIISIDHTHLIHHPHRAAGVTGLQTSGVGINGKGGSCWAMLWMCALYDYRYRVRVSPWRQPLFPIAEGQLVPQLPDMLALSPLPLPQPQPPLPP